MDGCFGKGRHGVTIVCPAVGGAQDMNDSTNYQAWRHEKIRFIFSLKISDYPLPRNSQRTFNLQIQVIQSDPSRFPGRFRVKNHNPNKGTS